MFGIDDAAIATILAGLASTAGALYTNKKNRDAQADANAINWEIARQNNATQIEMANTAHQREIRDLRAAGLNPILSAGGNGSSTPTLSAASMSPVHQDNAFEGLANSAKGLGRYMSEQYKQQVNNLRSQQGQIDASTAALEADTAATRLDNQYKKELVDADLWEMDARRSEAHNAWMQSVIERQAMCDLFGANLKMSKQGNMVIDDWGQFRKAVDLAKEGIESDMKVRSNQNWRANLSSFTPFVSPSAVNSAGSAAQRFKSLFK